MNIIVSLVTFKSGKRIILMIRKFKLASSAYKYKDWDNFQNCLSRNCFIYCFFIHVWGFQIWIKITSFIFVNNLNEMYVKMIKIMILKIKFKYPSN